MTVELCRLLTTVGAGVVTFDFYSTGDTPGDPNAWTYGRWASNLADVCMFVGNQEWADKNRIVALGISAGSTAVLRCAIDTSLLAAGISVASFLGHFVSMPNGPAKQLVDHLDTLESGGTVDVNVGESVVYRFGIDYYKDAIGGAPIYQLHRVTCPIFFLQGGDDNIYRRSDARLGYELMRSHDLPTAYREISEGDHTLGNVAPEGAEAVLAWLREMSFLGGALPESEV